MSEATMLAAALTALFVGTAFIAYLAGYRNGITRGFVIGKVSSQSPGSSWDEWQEIGLGRPAEKKP